MEPNSQKIRFASSDTPEWTIVSSSKQSSIVTGTNVAFPAGYQAGDAVLAVLFRDDGASTSVTQPAGWERIIDDPVASPVAARLTVDLLSRITTESTYTFNGTNSASFHLALIVLRPPAGFDTSKIVSSLVDASASVDSAGSSLRNPNPPAITTTIAGCTIFAVGMSTISGTLSTPSGYTTIVNNSTNTGYNVVYRKQDVEGTIDPGQMTNSTSSGTSSTIAATFALRTSFYNFKTTLTNFTTNTVDFGGIAQESVTQTFNAEEAEDSGLAQNVPISISGGNSAEYQINGGAWTSSSGTINNGDTINVRQTSVAGTSGTTTASTCTLTIGGSNFTYTLNTRRELVVVGTSTDFTISNAGITSLYVVGTGAGGAGGDAYALDERGGGGGGGGAMSITPSLAVSNGDILSIVAGIGGATANARGGNSTITISSTVVWRAEGGRGGSTATSTVSGAGGRGGTVAGSIGTIVYAGGNGGSGINTGGSDIRSGGGGGAGGYSGNGGNGAIGSSSGATVSSSDATGGAASGGASGCGGGGTGISGEGTSGAAATGGGNEGSPDAYATNGTSFVIASEDNPGDAGNGGTSGGGGGGGIRSSYEHGIGGNGAIRITW